MKLLTVISIITFQLLYSVHSAESETHPNWRWECQKGYCQKLRNNAETYETALSLSACRLFCSEHGGIWPLPTEVDIGQTLAKVNLNSIDIMSMKGSTAVADLIQAAGKRFKKIIESLAPESKRQSGGKSLLVNIDLVDYDTKRLKLETDESYMLTVTETSDGRLNATIKAQNYFGGRHGLETLSQLVIYDDQRGEVQLPNTVTIKDKPAYPHRGILLDTARSFISVASIKRTLDGMASSKLNTFHWHITDSHSFPYVSKSQPTLSKLGAYSQDKVYSAEEIADIVQYARVRGIRVLAEFDAPAHVAEGWQDTGHVACLDKKPWQQYCVEPPCGQLDPTREGVYDVLDDIYSDMSGQFDMDMFHMGGDEVSLTCWNSTDSIVQWMQKKGWTRSEADFMRLWDHFQSQALTRFDRHQAKPNVPIVMWTSHLTESKYVHYLPTDRYIVQVWTLGNDAMVKDLLAKDYRLILSNYDALYLDCGFGGWVAGGNNWCSPYIGWQKVYDNRIDTIAGDKKHLILGGETALWSEQVDDANIDSRLWPRSSAWAERLWADPSGDWKAATQRMLVQRERLVAMGISADLLQPEWCLQHEDNCPLEGTFNHQHSKPEA